MKRSLVPDTFTGRRHDPEIRVAIMSAALELFDQLGFQGLTVGAVAARAGVGKATIYRWWPNKGLLVAEAFLEQVATPMAFPETSSAEQDIRVQMQSLAQFYNGKEGRIVREMIAYGQFDDGPLALFRDAFFAPRRAKATEALQRGIASGEFREGFDLEDVVDALYGGVFHRVLVRHASPTVKFISFTADAVFGMIRSQRVA